jgi:uncharacterized membrane protein (UPF0127 family)
LRFNHNNRRLNHLSCQGLGSDSTLEITKQPIPQLSLVQANTLSARLFGLLGKRMIAPTEALWLKPCLGVHTFGMRFAIAVFFIDNQGAIVKTIARLKPNRLAWCWQAKSVVETVAFEIDRKEEMNAALMQALSRCQSC